MGAPDNPVLLELVSLIPGSSLPLGFGDYGFQVTTIGVYHAMGVPFGEGFLFTRDIWGHLWPHIEIH